MGLKLLGLDALPPLNNGITLLSFIKSGRSQTSFPKSSICISPYGTFSGKRVVEGAVTGEAGDVSERLLLSTGVNREGQLALELSNSERVTCPEYARFDGPSG
ncbi:hypothetical protein EVAR_92647_1 [Eumeta japonica]|uniref:Uncharacterized protein n=1 Tax=Eumeta variegata TaxID=151549 RepID=A0A4C1SXM3_EUMVA|nr:hypothetical protein EVAR_92647_1 [Eumeta japonica]